jgi:DeoR/GlpR family transcriptional regulator of sugar metabolism
MPQMAVEFTGAARALDDERRSEILAASAHGKVRATELATAPRVSDDTVRRDLDELADAGAA